MRTLIIDNYDSFTHNLFHFLAEVTGREPVVVCNDDPAWHRGRLEAFDAVVLSPGPGNPSNAADFGICREIVEYADLPLLGVCLGHQGLSLLHGATVGRAPEPWHGRLSPVVHDGSGLFEGLPSPFQAVRYHSLAVTDLPDELAATAWTPDGILMGVEHRRRPMWGVQFHPESVLTHHGKDLLANFARLAADRRAGSARPSADLDRPATGAPESASGSASAPAPAPVSLPAAVPPPARRRTLRVLVERMTARCDTEVAFNNLFRGEDHAFWLDSTRADADSGRFSVMGNASGPLARVARADTASGTVTVRGAGRTQTLHSGFLDWLDRDLRATETEIPPLPFDFALGWVGYLGYGLKAECGGEHGHRPQEPDAVMVFADRAAVFDHAAGEVYLLALAEDGDEAPASRWLREAAAVLTASAGRRATGAEPPDPLGAIRLRHDHDRYLELIARCQEEIAAGETYEVCLTNTAEVTGELDPWAAYRFLRRHSPAPYGALLGFGTLSVLSTSPERFLRIGSDGIAESRPIKGTRPRGSTPAEDAALKADLLVSEKDRAENLMIVDLVRNDLGRCAEPGSVEAEVFQVESYATVHQLTSRVRARLRPECSAVDCVRAAFPPGSMTGAPKIRTMRIIDELEGGPRGVYSGAIGYFSLNGAADLSVVIRTALVTPDRVRYGVGGAVIALSDPEEEFEETAVKAEPLLALIGASFPARRPKSLMPLGAAHPCDG
ncbi:aminodeoxychorismate synthase component I [Streptomyces lushanensis]|uniref:aminodeoxychorismate synthase component I n=1 Tax=Streptomyces lushanensis TaxID=1434255 RepID=UPI00082A1524|nr:aminodeoxychorismate synthase component I [Streptomyces lushanensis]